MKPRCPDPGVAENPASLSGEIERSSDESHRHSSSTEIDYSVGLSPSRLHSPMSPGALDDPPTTEPSTTISLNTNGNWPRPRSHPMQVQSSPPSSPSSRLGVSPAPSTPPPLSPTATPTPTPLAARVNDDSKGGDDTGEPEDVDMNGWPAWIKKAWETLSGERAPESRHWKAAITNWARLEAHYGYDNPNGVVSLYLSHDPFHR